MKAVTVKCTWQSYQCESHQITVPTSSNILWRLTNFFKSSSCRLDWQLRYVIFNRDGFLSCYKVVFVLEMTRSPFSKSDWICCDWHLLWEQRFVQTPVAKSKPMTCSGSTTWQRPKIALVVILTELIYYGLWRAVPKKVTEHQNLWRVRELLRGLF